MSLFSRSIFSGISMAMITLSFSWSSAASDFENENSDYVSYDSIVENLQKENAKQPAVAAARSISRKSNWVSSSSGADPFENVWIHAGVGFAQTSQNLSLPNGKETAMSGRGVQAAVGIDILGPNLTAEGAVRTFGETEDSISQVTLKEFDLKILFKQRAARLGFRAGGGLSARYMTVRSGPNTYDITTPASVVTIGGDIYLSSSVSLGIDLGTRNAMISETFDRSSFDGTVRLDTHF
jgi:hypothetical protein